MEYSSSAHVVFLPEAAEFNGERVRAVDNLSAGFVELAAVVEDEHHVALELVLVFILTCSHLRHDRRDVHRLAHHAAVLFI